MRAVRVTGGFSGVLVTDVSDTDGQMDPASFRVQLVPEHSEDLQVSDPGWQTPTLDASGAAAVLSVLVGDDVAPGHYWLAVDVITDGRHEVLYALDPDDSDRRALIYVT